MTDLTRRRALQLAGTGALATAGLSGCGWLSRPDQTGAQLTSAARLPLPYTLPLTRPPVLHAGSGPVAITAEQADVEVLPGYRTRMLTYAGSFPGPTIESRSGSATTVTYVNRLPVPLVTHLHGGHTPEVSDGFPIDLVLPAGRTLAAQRSLSDAMSGMAGMGSSAMTTMIDSTGPAGIVTGSRSYHYPMDQRAATLWYHDHRMDFTGATVYRGLAGFHLVRDAEEDAAGLPSGDHELPLMIADRAFDGDGQLLYPSLDPTLETTPGVRKPWMSGVLGDVICVNGRPWPVVEMDAVRYRLRLLNASNSRRYDLRLSPSNGGPRQPFVQVGSDGGLLAAPRGRDSIALAPAERCDVVVDFSEYAVGSTVDLVNTLGTGGTARVMRFRIARAARDDSRPPGTRLSDVEDLTAIRPVATRLFRFQQSSVAGRTTWTINGRAFDPDRPLFTVRRGAVERWRFLTDVHHPVHIHLDPFQVVHRGGSGPGDGDHGWKDTVDVDIAQVVEVAVRFTSQTGRYLLHCHNLEHEDMAMMATFRVV